MATKNVVIVEIEDGSVSDEKCFGDARVLTLDWDSLDIDSSEARVTMDELKDLGLPQADIQPYLDKLQVIIDDAEDSEDEEEDEYDDMDDEDEDEDDSVDMEL